MSTERSSLSELLRALNEIIQIEPSAWQVESIQPLTLIIQSNNHQYAVSKGSIVAILQMSKLRPRSHNLQGAQGASNTAAFQIQDFFLDPIGGSKKQSPPQAHSRTLRGCTGSNLINYANDPSCWWVAAAGSALDFLHPPALFSIFDFRTLLSHLLWQLVLPNSAVIIKG